MDGLAAQNTYLRDALEACRKQISELTQQVGRGCSHTPLSRQIASCLGASPCSISRCGGGQL